MSFIVLAFLFISSIVFASPCDEVMSTHVVTITHAGKPLVACAEATGGRVSDLTIIYGGKIVFEGDGAFKSYKVLTTKTDMFIDEDMLNQKTWKPMVQSKFQCTNNKCSFADLKCLWTKDKPNTAIVNEIKKYRDKKQTVPDSAWDQALLASLNGSKEALDIINTAKDSSWYDQRKNDISRLQKIGCL